MRHDDDPSPNDFGESSDGCLDQAQPTVTGAATVPELAQGILAPSLAPHAPAAAVAPLTPSPSRKAPAYLLVAPQSHWQGFCESDSDGLASVTGPQPGSGRPGQLRARRVRAARAALVRVGPGFKLATVASPTGTAAPGRSMPVRPLSNGSNTAN